MIWTTYKVMFSDDLGQTWRLWTAYASPEKAIRYIRDLVDRGYDRDLSIWVESHPPQEDCSHMDVFVPGEEVIFNHEVQHERETQKQLF